MPTDTVPEAGYEDIALAAVESTAAVRRILASLPPKQRATIAYATSLIYRTTRSGAS